MSAGDEGWTGSVHASTSDDSALLDEVISALCAELTARGLEVASDTLGMRREIYVIGDNDLARALFHFDTDAAEAAESIYRSSGSWSAGMPARFVALPADQAENPALEMLEQMRTTPLFWVVESGAVNFVGIDRALVDLVAEGEGR
jgi:hypothetical protein